MDNNTVYDASLDEAMEERSQSEAITDKSGKIVSYRYHILVRDKETLSGELSREDMDLMYRLYSSEGANLTQRNASRDFPQYTFQNFKKILRAFNITKASVPVAPHILLEKSAKEVAELTLQRKEENYLKFLEQNKIKLIQKKFDDVLKENIDLKEIINKGKHFLSNLDFNPVIFSPANNPNFKNTLLVYLADMHIGAHNSDEGVYDNPYNEAEANRRLEKIYQKISQIKGLDRIIVINLGDAIDGYNASTTRTSSTHILPQNMTNRQQGQIYIKLMMNFFNNIKNNIPCNEIDFYSVCESNHGGSFEASIVTSLAFLLDTMGICTKIAEKPIDHFKVQDKTIIYLHGKDNTNQFKNFPLTLDQKTELYMNEYILRNKLSGKIIVVKGDLHQTATTRGKQFTYKSVASLFGSSNWIHANFGYTPWGCDYTLINKYGDIIDGVIED